MEPLWLLDKVMALGLGPHSNHYSLVTPVLGDSGVEEIGQVYLAEEPCDFWLSDIWPPSHGDLDV